MTEIETKPAAAPGHAPAENQLLKLLVELGPLVIFFFANSRAGIYVGTGCFIVATIASLIASRVLFGRIPTMPLVSGFFVLVFGGLTLWLQNDMFIKLKPTIVNMIFAAILFGGLLYGQSLLKYLFGDVFRLTEEGWKKLTFRWACFFLFLAGLNEIAWRVLVTDDWVKFKVFAIMPITMVFAACQVGLLKNYEQQGSANE
jgi:intracellular septation protein